MLTLRPALRDDVPVILGLIRALAIYEREPDAVLATEADLLRDGFGERPAFHVVLAEDGVMTVGFALYFFSYSTWLGRRCLYLEDLFVHPEHRGQGAGIALMKHLAGIAVAEGCKRFVWQVLDWNAPSIEFYESLGAVIAREWLTVRLEGDALVALSQRDDRVRREPE